MRHRAVRAAVFTSGLAMLLLLAGQGRSRPVGFYVWAAFAAVVMSRAYRFSERVREHPEDLPAGQRRAVAIQILLLLVGGSAMLVFLAVEGRRLTPAFIMAMLAGLGTCLSSCSRGLNRE